MTTSSSFVAGDCVALNSGGPLMTVEDVNETAVTCSRFGGENLHRGVFRLEALRLSAPRIPDELALPVEVLGLTLRSLKLIKAEQMHTLHDLVTHTYNELLMKPNFGRKAVNEIKEVLAQRNLSLGTK